MVKLLRLRRVISPEGPIPVSASTWWAGVKSGRYPKGIKLGQKITAWREEDIAKLASTGASGLTALSSGAPIMTQMHDRFKRASNGGAA